MPILTSNNEWMLYNIFLALIAVVLGYLTLQINNKFLKIILGVAWFLFLPNTIYIFTDLEHLIRQWYFIRHSLRTLLVLQYSIYEIIGVITFVLAFIPFEKLVNSTKLFKKNKTRAYIIFNFVIAFGLVLGRVERINSWEVITNPQNVVNSAIDVFKSLDLLGLTILFGLVCNFIYFLLRNPIVSYKKKISHFLH
jgi:uncharacterized membrane protein